MGRGGRRGMGGCRRRAAPVVRDGAGGGLTVQRVIGLVLIIRCLTTPSVRNRFKWNIVDSTAVFYFAMLTISMIITRGPATGINNRGGFFLSALVPFWCVRFLVVDK